MNQIQRYNIYLLTRLSALSGFCKKLAKKYSFFSLAFFLVVITGSPHLLSAQTKDVILTGRITDSKTNDPLAGVVVHIKGTTHQVLTDEKGDFKFITGQRVPLVYELSYVGFKSKEIPVNSYDFVQLSLENNNKGLSEVVVVGYGTQRKSDITGSIASVPKGLLSIPATSFDNLLQGGVSGVSVTQSSGQPGSTSTIRIRGGNSITFGNDPLYVIDGFISYNNNALSNSGAATGPKINALATINPSDIESIEVLKDASATAIYGSRGANGVVIITTRRGKKGTDEVNYSGYYGSQQASKKLSLLNGSQWASLVNDVNISDAVAKTYSDSAINAFGKGYDWQNAGLRTAPVQNHELSVSGGDEKSRYLLSGNYYNQDGVVLNTNFIRYSGRLNYERNVSENFKFGTNLFVSKSALNGLSGASITGITPASAWATLLQTVPIVPIKNANGSYNTNNPYLTTPTNPLQDIANTTNQSNLTRTLGNIYLEYKILSGLTLKVTGGVDLFNTKQNYYAPSNTSGGYASGGLGSVGTVSSTSWLNENTLTYDHSIQDKHFFTILAGYTTQSQNDESAVASAQKFPNDLTSYNNLAYGATAILPSSNSHSSTLNSFLGRVSYSYLHKYNITISERADGASVLGANNKWGYFPSLGLSWNVSQEDFFTPLTGAINNLKIRASAGQTGNSNVPPYSSLAALSPTNYYFNNTLVTGIAPVQLANPDLKWETTTQYDAGLDLGLFKNRISLVLDAYYKKTTDLLLNVPFPLYTGYASVLENVGSVENKGIEISLNADVIRNKDLVWHANLIFAKNENKVLSLGNGAQNFTPTAPTGQQSPVIVQVGLPVGTFWGYSTNGLLTADDIAKGVPLLTGVPQKIGDRKYVALNGHTSVTSIDKHNLGSSQPDFTYGFSNTVSFKGFDLSFLLQGSYGNKLFNQFEQLLEKPTLALNAAGVLADRWTATNTGGTIPRATNSPVPQVIDRYVEDASYLRLKNLTIGFNLPKELLSKIHVKQFRIYVGAQNLFTITHYTGYDPEANYFDGDNTKQGIDFGVYPAVKTYLVGVNLAL
jgi:TonB-dependent starch-binding outer membrane protein SusC